MKNIKYSRVIVSILFCLAASFSYADSFLLKSSSAVNQDYLSEESTVNALGCHGKNISPALDWESPPEGTKSFALLVRDPDAQTGGAGIWHWLVYDIPAEARKITQGAGKVKSADLPSGAIQVRTDYEIEGWGGPCPPVRSGDHRYQFTLYALKVDHLEVPLGATASHVGFLVLRQSIGFTQLTMKYRRD